MDEFQQEPQDFEEEIISESAPETQSELEGEQPEEEAQEEDKVTFDERQQAKIDSLIAQKVAKQRAAEREAEEYKRKLAEFEASQPQPKEPVIPDLPNPDDYYGDPEGYTQKLQEREKAIAERAEFQAAQRAREQWEQQEAYKKQQAQQKEAEERVKGYVERAKSLGVDEQAMQRDAQTVAEYLSQDLQDFIVNDQHGPLISSYLANNLLELDNVRSMSPIEAAAYIASELRPKVSGTRKTTQAPKPASIVNGGAAPERKHPALEGVKFE